MSGAPGAEVYRIEWIPGSDELLGVCHCGAEHREQDPIQMWEWMLGHPTGHQRTVRSTPSAEEGGIR